MPLCREMAELATDYMEHALPLRQHLSARVHLQLCGFCRAYYDQLHKLRRLLACVPLPPPPPGTEAQILARQGEG